MVKSTADKTFDRVFIELPTFLKELKYIGSTRVGSTREQFYKTSFHFCTKMELKYIGSAHEQL